MLIGSEILLAVIFFGDKCKQMLEAIIFVFVMHPFDVGDRVEVDGLQVSFLILNIYFSSLVDILYI